MTRFQIKKIFFKFDNLAFSKKKSVRVRFSALLEGVGLKYTQYAKNVKAFLNLLN